MEGSFGASRQLAELRGADPYSLRGYTTGEITAASGAVTETDRQLRQLDIAAQRNPAITQTEDFQQLRMRLRGERSRAQARQIGYARSQFESELSYSTGFGELALSEAMFGSEADVLGAYGYQQQVYEAASRFVYLNPLERERFRFQSRYAIFSAMTEYRLGTSFLHMGVGLSQAGLATTLATTWGGGDPGAVFQAAATEVTTFTERLRDVNRELASGTMTYQRRLQLESEANQLRGAIVGGGYRARMDYLTTRAEMFGMEATSLGLGANVLSALGFSSEQTLPYLYGQAEGLFGAAGTLGQAASLLPPGSPQRMRLELAAQQYGAQGVGTRLQAGIYSPGAEWEESYVTATTRLQMMMSSLAVPGSVRDAAVASLGLQSERLGNFRTYRDQVLANASPWERPTLSLMFRQQEAGYMTEALPTWNYLMGGWRERLLADRYGAPSTIDLASAGFGGLSGIVQSGLGVETPYFGLGSRGAVENWRSLYAPFTSFGSDLQRFPGSVLAAGLSGIPTMPRSGGPVELVFQNVTLNFPGFGSLTLPVIKTQAQIGQGENVNELFIGTKGK